MTNQEFLRSITQEGEEWRDVIGYEGRYMVSSFGRVVSISKRKKCPIILKQRVNERFRYPTVVLYGTDNVYYSHFVHRLVAEAFIPNPENKPYIDHLDTIASNNKASNLKWVTQTENLCNPITKSRRVGSKHIITPPNRRKIVQIKDGVVIASYDYICQAHKFGYHSSGIIRCCSGKYSEYKGFQWMYRSDYEASNQ